MRHLVFLICILGFVTSSWAEQQPNYEAWKFPDRLERWQGLSRDMNYTRMFILIEEMYYLPRKPWSEPLNPINS